MRYNIGVFISSTSVGDEIKRLSKKQKDIFHLSDKSLEAAVPVGESFEQRGIEVIVARRGTAHLLRENLKIPVLSLPISSLSTLASIKRAKEQISGTDHRKIKIFMPNFRNKISGLEIIGDVLDIEFVQGVYTDSQSLDRILGQAAGSGFSGVVGGQTTRMAAAKYGLHFQELISTRSDIVETVENAKSAAQANREEKARSKRYQSIINLASDGIISLDSNGNLTTINQKARQIFQAGPGDLSGTSIRSLIPSTNIRKALKKQTYIRDKIETIGNDMFVYNQVPLTSKDRNIGVVATLNEVGNVMRTENKVRKSLTKGFVTRYTMDDLKFQSPVMKELAVTIKELAKTQSTIVITGETGTGKELVAQSVHNLGTRRKQAFVSVNCGAIPEQLLESELFGHEEGAFTGSKKGGKPGLFEMAHQGTIFLDEIDSTAKNVQLRLLRVLQEKEVMRIGGDRKIPVDVRVIAAAGKDLWQAVLSGSFRKDLFFRLNVLRITVPPLRQRTGDVPMLLTHFTRYYAEKHKLPVAPLPAVYMNRLVSYSWPGNVRQLKHFAEQLLLTSSLHQGTDALFDQLHQIAESQTEYQTDRPPLKNHLKLSSAQTEQDKIIRALEQARFSKGEAARLLGISRTTLWRKLKKME